MTVLRYWSSAIDVVCSFERDDRVYRELRDCCRRRTGDQRETIHRQYYLFRISSS